MVVLPYTLLGISVYLNLRVLANAARSHGGECGTSFFFFLAGITYHMAHDLNFLTFIS